MQNDIYLIGEVGYEITLDSVIDMVSKSDKNKPININIHSKGGSVYDGLAIYNYLKGLNQEINTSSIGLVASIASIIYLSGNKKTRKINSTDSFLIHLPSGMNFGNSSDFEKTAKELKDIEVKLSKIYANETNLTEEEALDLMKKDEMLDVNFLKEKGFVSKIIEFNAVANFNNNNNNKTMTKISEEDKNWFKSLFKKAESKFNLKNKIVQDGAGTEIDFYELNDDDIIKVETKARVNGEDADGEYVMPNGDIYKFDLGVLKTITNSEDVNNEEINALKKENESLKKQIKLDASTKKEYEANLKYLEKDFNNLKSKITSSFEWDGNKKKKEKENETRSFNSSNFKTKK